ncbi:MAG: hypothetical protein R6U17_06010 [Thermoplasmata archaeon]
MDERVVQGLKERKREIRSRIEILQKRVDELEDEEERLSNELERVRNYVVYYGSLVSDMKRHMQGRGSIDIFEFL